MQNQKAARYYQEGKAHFQKGRLSSAESAYRKAIKFNPDHVDAHNDLGNLYLQKGQLRESYNAYRKALRILPNHPMLLNNVGNVLMMQGEFEKARSALDKAVEQDPKSAAAHCNLGSTLRGLGDSRGAVIAFKRAIELDPRQPVFLCNLADALIELEDWDGAADCYRQALQINPDSQRACQGLGKVCNARGDFEQAVASYQKAISIDSGNARSYSGLGRVFEDHGDNEKALASVQTAIEIDPGNVSAYQILARNKKFTQDDSEIKAMEALFARKEMSDMKKSQLAFSLGKAYEDIGEYDKSMEFVTKAARLRRSLYEYSISDSAAAFDKIKQVFSPEFFAECADCGAADRTPIFIVGMPRSGTTLVEQILATHPEVFGAGELNDLAQVYRSIENSADRPPVDNFPQDLIGLDPAEYASLGKQYVERIRKYSADAGFITDKLPHNFLRIGFIRAILPNARIINCTRNPLDNCLSLFKTDFQKGHLYSYDLSELGQYYKLYLGLMDYWKTTLPGFIHNLNYEELVSDQEEQSRRLLQYCGLPWDDACLQFHHTQRRIATASNAQVQRPIYRDSVDLWTRYEQHLKPLISILDA